MKWNLIPAGEIFWARERSCGDGGSKGAVTELRCLHVPFAGGQRYMGVSHVLRVGHAGKQAAWYRGAC